MTKFRVSDADARTVRASQAVTYHETAPRTGAITGRPAVPRRPMKRLYGQDARNWLAARTAENEELKKMTKSKPKAAAKKPPRKTTKFEVTVTRTLEHSAVVTVEAFDAEEAKAVALTAVDDGSTRWVEGDLIAQDAKVKVSRE